MLILRLRRLRALRRGQRRQAFRGMSIGLLVMGFVLVGSALQSGRVPPGWVLTCGLGTCLATVAAYVFVKWGHVRTQTLLLFPGIWLLGLLGISLQVGQIASNFVGLTVLAFLFGGVTQRRWQTLWLLIPAVPTWLVMVLQVGGATSLWLRFPIVLALWISASELVAEHTQSMSTEVRRLTRAVDVDELTGLANRRALAAALSMAVAGDALILIDIDHFKSINDLHGHSTGDVVLAEFARMVRRCIRFDDEAIRYGGEEILVVMRDPGADGVHRFDAQLRAEIRTITPAVTFSAGATTIAPSETSRDALERADKLLYEVKVSGRNRTVDASAAHLDPGTQTP